MTPELFKDIFSKPYSRLLILCVIGVVVGAGVLTGHHLQQDNQTGKKVIAWKTKYAYLITNLTDDFKQAETDSQANNTPKLQNDCLQVVKDVKIAQSKPAIPNIAIQANWAAGLKDDSAGGTNCSNGIKDSDSTLMTAATSDFTAATKALSAASTELKAAKN